MNLEDQLRGAADAAIGAMEGASDDGLERLRTDYAARLTNPLEVLAFDQAFQETQLGPAAYTLGVHYLVQDKLDEADYWLRIAAQKDIGDAALRLAQLCELRAVRDFNKNEGDTSHPALPSDQSMSFDQSMEARYWYERASIAGYAGGRSGMLNAAEQPNEPLDCCGQMAIDSSIREASELVLAARAQALDIVREARRDARQVIDDAREEVEELAVRRQATAAQLAQLRSTLEALAGLISRGNVRKGGIRSLVRRTFTRETFGSRVARSAMSADMASCAQILSGVEGTLSPRLDEIPSRTSVAGAISSIATATRSESTPQKSETARVRKAFELQYMAPPWAGTVPANWG